MKDLLLKLTTRFGLLMTCLCVAGAAGCVSYPISKQLRQQARATKDVSFLTIWQNPEAYEGHTVIWGGKIIMTLNNTNGGSVTVLQTPLGEYEHPLSTKLSQGRFIVRSPEFMDPEVYRKGAKITIAGDLDGTETNLVGKASYAYPIVTLRDVYFWKPHSSVQVASVGWGYEPYGPYGAYNYGYDGYPGYDYPDYDLDWGLRVGHPWIGGGYGRR